MCPADIVVCARVRLNGNQQKIRPDRIANICVDTRDFGSDPKEEWFFHAVSWDAETRTASLAVSARHEALQVPNAVACPGLAALLFDRDSRRSFGAVTFQAYTL